VRIVFLGDSLTEGVDGASYLRLLRERIAHDPLLRDIELINAGVGGDTVVNLPRRVSRDVVPLQPNWVVVFIGVNDCATLLTRRATPSPRSLRSRRYFRREKGVRGAITPGRFRDGLRALVDGLRARTSARVALCTPAVFGERLSSRSWRLLDEYVAATRLVAAERGCALIDVHAAFARELAELPALRPASPLARWRMRRRPTNSYEMLAAARGQRFVYDDVHFNARGAALVAEVMLDWLQAMY
jgi:lysophospholipase L1-like esterase